MDVNILLPTRIHVKKFLEKRYGPRMILSSRGPESQLIRLMLHKPEKTNPALVRPSQKLIDNINYFPYPVYIGAGLVAKRGCYLSREDILDLNDSLDDLMKFEMYSLIQKSLSPGYDNRFEVDLGIKKFRDLYDLSEDDITFDNLKRWYYRNRARIEGRADIMPAPKTQLQLTF